MKTIFIFTDIGFSKRDYIRFGIEDLEKFSNVYVLDLTAYFQKKFSNYNKEEIYKYKNYTVIKSINECKDFIKKKKCNYSIDYMNNNDYAFQVREELKNYGVKQIYIQNGLAPNNNRTFKEYFLRAIGLLSNPIVLIKKIFFFTRNRYIDRKLKKINFEYLKISGTSGMQVFRKKKKKNILFGHSFDYEKFLNSKKKIKYTKKYFVFLDQYLPFHPGYIQRGEKPEVTAEKYYPAMNNLFSYLEKKFNIEVIIASHPRADYSSRNNFFGDREIIKSDSMKLVENSISVLTHYSSSISYAIIYNKPIIFLNSNEIIKSFIDFYINNISRELGSTLINIDQYQQDKKRENLLIIDKSKYQLYFDRYIKHPKSSNFSNWKTLENNLR